MSAIQKRASTLGDRQIPASLGFRQDAFIQPNKVGAAGKSGAANDPPQEACSVGSGIVGLDGRRGADRSDVAVLRGGFRGGLRPS